MNAESRGAIKAHGVSIWLKADLDVLLARVKRRSNRPLIKGDNPEAVMRRLMDERYPVYAEADIHIHSREVAHETVMSEILEKLAAHLKAQPTEARHEHDRNAG
jgi:shikimate kinase